MNKNTYTEAQAQRDRQLAYDRFHRSSEAIEKAKEDRWKEDTHNYESTTSAERDRPYILWEVAETKRLKRTLEDIDRRLHEYVPTDNLVEFDWERAENLIKDLYTDFTLSVYDRLRAAIKNRDFEQLSSELKDEDNEDIVMFCRFDCSKSAFNDLRDMCSAVGRK